MPGLSLFPPEIDALAAAVLDGARTRGLWVTAAESCTGGLVLGALTEVAGASAAVAQGVVTYADSAKRDLLGVPEAVLRAHGAVSEPVARAMAEGALARSGADLAVAVTGVAGPGGGSAGKPVGTVWFATAMAGAETQAAQTRFGDLGRGAVRLAAVRRALELLRDRLG